MTRRVVCMCMVASAVTLALAQSAGAHTGGAWWTSRDARDAMLSNPTIDLTVPYGVVANGKPCCVHVTTMRVSATRLTIRPYGMSRVAKGVRRWQHFAVNAVVSLVDGSGGETAAFCVHPLSEPLTAYPFSRYVMTGWTGGYFPKFTTVVGVGDRMVHVCLAGALLPTAAPSSRG